jgi:hypothetical protein
VNPADAMIMSTKTTHSVFLPESPMNWSSGVLGTTEGMGRTPVGVLVGTGRREVFFKASWNCSAIMMAVVCDGGAGIDSSPVERKSSELERRPRVIKSGVAGSCFMRVMRRVRSPVPSCGRSYTKLGSHVRHFLLTHARSTALHWPYMHFEELRTLPKRPRTSPLQYKT